MKDEQLFILTLIISISSLGFFIWSFRKNKTSLINGLIFNLFFIFLATSIVIGGILSSNPILKILLLLVLGVFIIIISFGIIILILGLLINSRLVLKREKRSLANILSLLLALGLIGYFIIDMVTNEIHSPFLDYFMVYIGILITYFGLSFYNFIVISILNNLYRPKLNKDYIIVLGSGLIDGHRISKLLGSRIDRAIEFFQLQKENGMNSKIIFSGGQGKDEKIPEAEAMANYAMNKGLLEDDLIREDKSRTTLDNFKFSKEIMDKEMKDYKAIFSTSNYHVFRASIYAKIVGLDISGIGSKTAPYFLPNAMIREYIAILAMKKRSYIVKLASITIIFIIGAFIYSYLEKLV